MRKLFIMCIMIIVTAGLILTPACTIVGEAQGASKTTSQPNSGSSSAGETNNPYETQDRTASPNETDIAPNPDSESKDPSISGDTPTPDAAQDPDEDIDIITTDEELEEYFNSITDEEIEELFKIIEDIDISPDIGVDSDIGFEDIIIP
jgi:hypothetical protein